jgi:TM2 domain-containing membrane protein YozV
MKNPGLAAVMSFFIVGLGQIYNGHIGKGLLMIVGYYAVLIWGWGSFISAMFGGQGGSGLVVFAPFILVIVWIWNVVDAYKQADKYNKQHATAQ